MAAGSIVFNMLKYHPFICQQKFAFENPKQRISFQNIKLAFI